MIYKNVCNDCGRKLYNIKREATGITICEHICKSCNKKEWIIPASDWKWMCKETEDWD